MATTGIINATDINIYFDDTTNKKVAHCTSAELSMSMAMRDSTTKDSAGYSASLPGLRSWEMSGEAFYAQDPATDWDMADLYDAYSSRTELTVVFSTEVSGDLYYSGACYLNSLSSSAGVEENATISFSLTGTAALTEATGA